MPVGQAKGAVVFKTVEDVMTRDVVTVGPQASFREAVRLLQERHVDALPVVDDAGRVLGMIGESDLLLKEEQLDLGHAHLGLPWQQRRDRARAGATTVRQATSRHVVTVRADATLYAAARLMHRHRLGGLPVVDQDRRLLGIVTRSDLLRVFLREDDDLREDVMAALGGAAGDITCTVLDGTVTLTGHVTRRSRAAAAAAAAHRVAGVIDVRDEVRYDADDVAVAMVGP